MKFSSKPEFEKHAKEQHGMSQQQINALGIIVWSTPEIEDKT
jgi:hypothetical protein